MSTTTPLITADELFRLTSDGKRHELVRGELKSMTPAGFAHGLVAQRLGAAILQFATQNRLGVVPSAETGFALAKNPDTVRGPDVAFVAMERLATIGVPMAYFPGAPDLAVEVVSPGDTVNEVDEKTADWLAHGTRQVWVVNPRTRRIAVHRSATDIVHLSASDTLEGGDVLPGFALPVADVFVDLDV